MIQRQNNETEIKNDAKKVSDVEDNGYFETYAHYGIHHDMLSVSIFINSLFLEYFSNIIGVRFF